MRGRAGTAAPHIHRGDPTTLSIELLGTLAARRHPSGRDSPAFLSITMSSAVGEAPGGVIMRLRGPTRGRAQPFGDTATFTVPSCRERDRSPIPTGRFFSQHLRAPPGVSTRRPPRPGRPAGGSALRREAQLGPTPDDHSPLRSEAPSTGDIGRTRSVGRGGGGAYQGCRGIFLSIGDVRRPARRAPLGALAQLLGLGDARQPLQ